MPRYTVLTMLPSDLRQRESCAADEVYRAHVTVPVGSEDVQIVNAMEEAIGLAAKELDWPEPDDFEVVAIYRGHLMDLHQP